MHGQTVSVAPEECAPPIFEIFLRLGPSPPAAGEPASRRRQRITFSRTNFTYHQQGTRGTEIPFPLCSRAFAYRARGGSIPRARGARGASSARRWLFPETRAAADRSRSFFSRRTKHAPDLRAERIERAENTSRRGLPRLTVRSVTKRPFARPESRSSRRTRRVSYPSRRQISNSPDGRRADLSIVPFLSSRRRQHGYRRQGTPFHRDLRSRRLR